MKSAADRRRSTLGDCIFCKIGQGELPAKLIYQDADVFAFEDAAPQAPTHILICPRTHILSLSEATAGDAALLGRLQLVAAQVANERGITSGYRTIINNGKGAGQSVFHLHVHLLAGREFRWPPG
jgi:histidine triad (HIT) family protein